MSEKRFFSGSTVGMLIACKVISDHLERNISDLSKVRTNWTPAYVADLLLRVGNVAAACLGVKTRDLLFDATNTLTSLIGPAREMLASLKTQINVDFGDDEVKCVSILSKLGYSTSKKVVKLNQSQLVTQLVTFKRNLTAELQTEITSKGIPADLLKKIADMADPLDKANVTQEQLKATVKEVTGNLVKDLNALYKEIIGVCKIAANHYKKDSIKKEMFTYSKVLSNQGESRVAKEKPETTTASKAS